jgi:hypothetical protein
VRLALLSPMLGCTTIDPGPNFVVADETFDPDFFYCHVEPELIFAKRCGPGDPQIDQPNSCHFTPSAVSGMPLADHPAVNCGGGDHPLDLSQVGANSPAQGNFVSVSLEMSRDYMTAPLLIRPSGNAHPRAVFARSDPAVQQLLASWAAK